MNLSMFSTIWFALYMGFGTGLLIIPAQFMATYGVTLDGNGTMMTRILGAALIAFAITFWLNRNILLSEKSWRNLLLASFVYNVIDIPIVTMATLNGVMNSVGWVPVFLHLFLAATMGYFVFKKNESLSK
jgi:hypothetical protein